jgi:hypothetical protein
MDAGSFGEYVFLHLGVPPARLVPEVDPGFQEFPDAYFLGCALQTSLYSLFLGGLSSARACAIRIYFDEETPRTTTSADGP